MCISDDYVCSRVSLFLVEWIEECIFPPFVFGTRRGDLEFSFGFSNLILR